MLQGSLRVTASNPQGLAIVCYRGHLGLLPINHRVTLLCVQGSLGVTANNPEGLAIVCYRGQLGLFQITHQV